MHKGKLGLTKFTKSPTIVEPKEDKSFGEKAKQAAEKKT